MKLMSGIPKKMKKFPKIPEHLLYVMAARSLDSGEDMKLNHDFESKLNEMGFFNDSKIPMSTSLTFWRLDFSRLQFFRFTVDPWFVKDTSVTVDEFLHRNRGKLLSCRLGI